MALRHFEVESVLKIDETVYKQAEPMCPQVEVKSVVFYCLHSKQISKLLFV